MRMALFALSLLFTGSTFAMPCDWQWSCKSISSKFTVVVDTCNDSNAHKLLRSLKLNGKEIKGAELTASYDSVSVGGHVLAFEIQIPDSKNDAHYLSFESNGETGQVTDRIQRDKPGKQKVVGSEKIVCKISDL